MILPPWVIYIGALIAGLVVIALGVVIVELLTAPVGYEDEHGFSYGVKPAATADKAGK